MLTRPVARRTQDPERPPKFKPRDLTGIWMQTRARPFPSYPFNAEYEAIFNYNAWRILYAKLPDGRFKVARRIACSGRSGPGGSP